MYLFIGEKFKYKEFVFLLKELETRKGITVLF